MRDRVKLDDGGHPSPVRETHARRSIA